MGVATEVVITLCNEIAGKRDAGIRVEKAGSAKWREAKRRLCAEKGYYRSTCSRRIACAWGFEVSILAFVPLYLLCLRTSCVFASYALVLAIMSAQVGGMVWARLWCKEGSPGRVWRERRVERTS